MKNTQIKHNSTRDEWILQDGGFSNAIAVNNANQLLESTLGQSVKTTKGVSKANYKTQTK